MKLSTPRGALHNGVPIPRRNTLTVETILFQGTFAPGFSWSASPGDGNVLPAEVPITLTPIVGPVPHDPIPLPSEDLEAVCSGGGLSYSYTAVGTPEPFSVGTVVSSSNDEFDAAQLDLFARTRLPPGDAPHGVPPFVWTPIEDLLAVNGTLNVTYNCTPAAPASVPEPASLALLGFGLVALCAGARRRL